MASVSATSVKFISHRNFCGNKLVAGSSNVKFVSMGMKRTGFPSRLSISCVAKPETVEKVVQIVKKQLALAADANVTPETKFSSLGADSLDTVEIVMGLEEEFDITVEEDSSNNITTIQEAADLIDDLIGKKAVA